MSRMSERPPLLPLNVTGTVVLLVYVAVGSVLAPVCWTLGAGLKVSEKVWKLFNRSKEE